MINMSLSDKTCNLSTSQHLCNIYAKYNFPAIVTFDQPPFWKASEIINEVHADSPIWLNGWIISIWI